MENIIQFLPPCVLDNGVHIRITTRIAVFGGFRTVVCGRHLQSLS